MQQKFNNIEESVDPIFCCSVQNEAVYTNLALTDSGFFGGAIESVGFYWP
jgi:hypothetical protein